MRTICCYMDRKCTPECTAYMDMKQFKGNDPFTPDIQCIRLFVEFATTVVNTLESPSFMEDFDDEEPVPSAPKNRKK